MDDFEAQSLNNDNKAKEAKRTFMFIGFAFFAMIVFQTPVAILLNYLGVKYFPDIAATEWFYWLSRSGTLYLLGMPVSALLLSRIPKRSVIEPDESGKVHSKKITLTDFIVVFLIGISIMRIGGYVSQIINSILAPLGWASVSGLDSVLTQSNPIAVFAIVVLIGPFLEELFCRKLLIDRVSAYGPKCAIFTSAIIFGLLHGNLEQFFYAFGLGLLLSYIYITTGSFKTCACLHMVFNFIGGFIPSMILKWLTSNPAWEAVVQLSLSSQSLVGQPSAKSSEQMIEMLKAFGEMFFPLMVLVTWAILLMALSVCGIVLFFTDRKKISLFGCRAPEYLIPRERRGEIIFYNIGIFLFAIAATVKFVLNSYHI